MCTAVWHLEVPHSSRTNARPPKRTGAIPSRRHVWHQQHTGSKDNCSLQPRSPIARQKRGERKRERERERRETERARERVSKGGRQERREMVNQPSSADDCHSLRLLLRLEQGFVIVIEQHTPESLAYPNSVQAEDCTFGYNIEKWSLLAPCVAVLVLQAAVPL